MTETQTKNTSTNSVRVCQNCKNTFTIEPEDFAFYEKMQVPPPTWCPECRLKRRLSWRNERNLFRAKDAATGKDIFTGITPHAPIKIYDIEYWRSDSWDPLDYGREYDFSRPFFEQWKESAYAIPWPSRSVIDLVNSDYCDQAGHLKNCYLCFNLDYVEDAAYVVKSDDCKNVIDLFEAHRVQLSYDSAMIDECFRAFYSIDCDSCTDVWFSKNLIGCNNCIGCMNLRNKSYHIFNAPYSKEEYTKKREAMNLHTRQGVETVRRESELFWKKFPVKFMRGLRNTGSSGEALRNTKNAEHCYMIQDAENIKYVQMTYLNTTNSYDYTVWGNHSSQMYESLTCGEKCDNLRFCFDCWPACRNLEYCVSCRSSENCFACIGLKKKQYCIFNKQYTEESFDKLRTRIVEHMNVVPYVNKRGATYRYGEFFPQEFSPFAFNETMLADYFPLTKEEALREGYVWRDPESREFQVTITAENIPDAIDTVDSGILKEILQCGECKKAFRIIEAELEFYRRLKIPLPDRCSNCRYSRRRLLTNLPKFFEGNCACAGIADKSGVYKNTVSHHHGNGVCPNKFETSYAPDRKEIVYCESCYNIEVV